MKDLKPDEWGGFKMCVKWNYPYIFLYAKTYFFNLYRVYWFLAMLSIVFFHKYFHSYPLKIVSFSSVILE